jgi:hypothetical protein
MHPNNSELKFQKFEKWAVECSSFREPATLEILTIEHAIPPCIRLDIFNEVYAGRITLRNDGVCDIEVIQTQSEETVLYQNAVVDFDNLQVTFASFVRYFDLMRGSKIEQY